MNITIHRQVFRKFDDQLRVGFVLIHGLDNQAKLQQSLHLLRDEYDLVRQTFHPETLKFHGLITPWAVAQQEFGPKAKHYHTSVERLIMSVLKHKKVAAKDTVTNLIQYLSLRYIVPIGVDDFHKLKSDLTFTLATGTEKVGWFHLLKNEAFYYRDQEGILGTTLDHWKSLRTAPNGNTHAVLIHVEALPPITQKKLYELLREISSLVTGFCGGTARTFVLDKNLLSAKVYLK